jgi:hypothetical protein
MAGFLVFLGLILFMFKAGYEWRKWETHSADSEKSGTSPRDTMIWKI